MPKNETVFGSGQQATEGRYSESFYSSIIVPFFEGYKFRE